MGYKKYFILGLAILLFLAMVGCSSGPFGSSDDGDDGSTNLMIEELKIEDGGQESDGRKRYQVSVILPDNLDESELTFNWAVDDGGRGDILGEGSEVVYIAPLPEDFSPDDVYTITVSISDNSGGNVSSSQKLTLPPEAGEIQVKTEDGSTRLEVGNYITISIDASGDNLNYTWYRKQEGDSTFSEIDASNSPRLTNVRIEEGTIYTYKVRVDDGYDFVERTRQIKVENAKPEIRDISFDPDRNSIYRGTEEVRIEIDAFDPDGDDDQLEYRWRDDAGNSLGSGDSITYQLPEGLEIGEPITITVEITDQDGQVLNREYIFSISELPTKYQGMQVTPEMPTVGESARLEVFFEGESDTEFDWSYKKSGADSWKSIDDNSAQVIWPAVDEPGSYRVRIQYEGENYETVTRERDLIVKAKDPSIREVSVTPSNEVNLGQEITLTADDVRDNVYHELDYSWEVIDGVGKIITDVDGDSITYKSDDPGEATIELTVSNDHFGEDTWREYLVINTIPPEIEQINVTDSEGETLEDPVTIYNDEQLNLSAEAIDPNDRFELEYSWRVGHREIGTGEEITYRPVDHNRMPNQGSHTVWLTVRNGEGGRDEKRAIEINLKNRLPEINQIIGNNEIEAGTIQRFTVDASDPDGEILSYSWEAERGDIDSTGRSVDYEAPTTSGSETITVTAKDGSGEEVEFTKEIFITSGELAITAFYSQHSLLAVSEETTIIVDVYDPEGAALNYNWEAEYGSIEGSGRSVTYTAPAQPRTEIITITVDDGSRNVTESLEIEIRDIWQQSYALGELQAGIEIQGGFMLAGSEDTNLALLEINYSGVKQDSWSYVGRGGSDDRFNAVVEGGNDYIMAGISSSSGYIIKGINEERTFQPGDKINDFERLNNGNYLSAGENDGSGYLILFDSDLTAAWSTKHGSQLFVAKEDGEQIVAAGEVSGSSYLVWVDGQGNRQNYRTYHDVDYFTDLVVNGDNTYILTSNDGQLFKINSEGTREWSRSYGGTLNAVISAGDGYLAVGRNFSGAYAIKVDSDGNREWSQEFSNGQFNGAIAETDGYILFGTDGDNQFVAKIDREGNRAR